jgi:hypothetical protein
MAATTPSLAPSATRDGKILVVPRGSAFPANCVKCGEPAERPWRKKFYWHHPALYLMVIFPGLLIYAIVAMVVRKSIELSVPLCDVHQSERKRYIIIGTILLLGCIPAGVIAETELHLFDGAGFIVGTLMFFAGCIFLARINPIRPKKIDEFGAEFTGASEEFLKLLPPKPAF